MPLNMPRQTIAQAANRQPVMVRFNSPVSSIESVMSKAFLNQKYVVGVPAAHSFSTDREEEQKRERRGEEEKSDGKKEERKGSEHKHTQTRTHTEKKNMHRGRRKTEKSPFKW